MGFYGGWSGVSLENNWLTATTDKFGTGWLLSTQTRHLYRGNGIDYTTNPNLADLTIGVLSINDGQQPAEDSDFACAEVIICDEELNVNEIICIEKYLNDKYDLSLAPYEPTTSPSNAPSYSPILPPTAGIYIFYI